MLLFVLQRSLPFDTPSGLKSCCNCNYLPLQADRAYLPQASRVIFCAQRFSFVCLFLSKKRQCWKKNGIFSSYHFAYEFSTHVNVMSLLHCVPKIWVQFITQWRGFAQNLCAHCKNRVFLGYSGWPIGNFSTICVTVRPLSSVGTRVWPTLQSFLAITEPYSNLDSPGIS